MKKNFRLSIAMNRQRGWRKISFLTARSIIMIYKTSISGQKWKRKIAKKDLRTISRLSSRGKYPEIITDDFLAW